MTMATGRNVMRMELAPFTSNVAVARLAIAAFIAPLDPTLEQLNDVKTAVSEAVTNAMIHGYGGDGGAEGKSNAVVILSAVLEHETVFVSVTDYGIGIEDLSAAREPLFTTKPDEERSGMGFTIMENFMDVCDVVSTPGQGTTVAMAKLIEVKKPMFN